MSAETPPALLPLGVLGRPHGVRGELVFRPHNPDGARLEDLGAPFAAQAIDARSGQARAVTVVGARPFKDGALVRFAGIDDRDAAAALTNRELHVPRALLPALGPGEFYVADLIGCTVHDAAGATRGKVVGAFWNGQQDVVTIAAPGGEELLLPVVPDFIVQVDLSARRIVIDEPEAIEAPGDGQGEAGDD